MPGEKKNAIEDMGGGSKQHRTFENPAQDITVTRQ